MQADWTNPNKTRHVSGGGGAGGDDEGEFMTVDYTTQKSIPKAYNKNKANQRNVRRVSVGKIRLFASADHDDDD